MLRAGCLPLEIEMGRYRKPKPVPLEERTCKMCQTGHIEDEKHFVMNCDLYIDQRDSLFDYCNTLHPDFTNMTNTDKFKFIMQTGDANMLNMIYKMYLRRTLFCV